MRNFLIKIVSHALISILITAIILIYTAVNIYPKSRIPKIKLKIIQSNKKLNDSLSIVLGSSHAFYGIDSKLIDGNCFNFASVSQGFMEDFEIVKYLNANNYKIKQIILPFSYFSNFSYLYKTDIKGENLRIFDYESAFNTKYPVTPKFSTRLLYISEISKTIFSQNKIEKFDKFGNLIGSCDYSNKEISDAKVAFKRHSEQNDFSKINPYFDSIYNYCLKSRVFLFVVIMPFSKSYRDLVNGTKFNNLISELKENYTGNDFRIIDNRDFFKVQEETSMFRDADHLSFCGREKFSNYLYNQIKSN